MSWKEYKLQNKRAAEHLSWGGITHPNILRCKDDSVLGIISYQPYRMEKETQRIALPSFQSGWSIWFEEQQERTGVRHSYLTVSWMPFRSMDGKVKNTLTGEKIKIEALEDALAATLHTLAASFPPRHRRISFPIRRLSIISVLRSRWGSGAWKCPIHPSTWIYT